VLIVVIEGLCAVLAVTCLIIALFLWPKDEHRLHVWLETFWVHVDDIGHRQQTRVNTFVAALARNVSGFYDNSLGERLFSERVVFVSFMVGNISSNIISYVQNREVFVATGAMPVSFYLTQAAVGVFLWLYVKFEHEKFWLRLLARFYVAIVGLLSVAMAFIWGGWGTLLLTVFGLVAAFSIGVLVLAMIRVLLRQAFSTRTAAPKALYLLGILFVGGMLLFVALNSHLLHPAHQGSLVLRYVFGAVGFVAMINAMNLLIIGTLLLGSFVLLIYRITWPVLSRTLYIAPRHRLVYRRQFLLTTALTFSVAFSSMVFTNGEKVPFFGFLRATSQPDDTVCYSAGLYGTVTTHGEPTDAWFEWGTTTAFGMATKHQIFDRDTSFRHIIINLSERTTYYYRPIVNNPLGRDVGDVKTFTTSECVR
jgi:hypothetical protein